MNYKEMNNHQINKRVARALGIEWVAVAQDGLIVDGKSASVDYCNNPSDAWELMVSNEISLVTLGDEWEAHHLDDYGDESNNIVQARPGRAVSICFLKMKDEEIE